MNAIIRLHIPHAGNGTKCGEAKGLGFVWGCQANPARAVIKGASQRFKARSHHFELAGERFGFFCVDFDEPVCTGLGVSREKNA